MVAHHTVNGCNLHPGDLLGSGTQSGPAPEEAGSLLELTEGGKKPLQLSNGEQRVFMEDGDTVILRGWAHKEGAPRIGLVKSRVPCCQHVRSEFAAISTAASTACVKNPCGRQTAGILFCCVFLTQAVA
jgi:hypothetical protein